MSLNKCKNELDVFFQALRFAARRHRDQRRKGGAQAPYINHPVEVAGILWEVGSVRDVEVLAAALLHDTVEDTGTTPDEIEKLFGERIRGLVMEVTDDKSLPKPVRKHLQVVHAPDASPGARQIELGDKISNVIEIMNDPPHDWTNERRLEYLDWTEKVIDGLRGQNPALEARYNEVLAEARKSLKK